MDAAIIQQVIMDRKIYGVFSTTAEGGTPFNTEAAEGAASEPVEPILLHERKGEAS